ncbi:MAG: AAA family ATPase [Bacteroidia bacterium]|nr:AAA family ATPase [Bacteroidia bacterium]
MKQARAELQHTLNLLLDEKQEDLRQFRELVLNETPDQRRQSGLTWYPLAIQSEDTGIGGKPVLTLERMARKGQNHRFQAGSVAAMFSLESKQEPLAGVVTRVKEDTLLLSVYQDEIPDWVYDEKIGLDLYFDERSYREMEFAMKAVLEAENNRLAELREICMGQKTPEFEQNGPVPNWENLNPSQASAVMQILTARDLALVHGPPGTGKTTTLMQAIRLTLKTEKQVLACAPSNAAADLLTEKLAEMGIEVVRLGHPARISDSLEAQLLDAKIKNHPSAKDLKQMQRQGREMREQALKFKRNFGREERENRKNLLSEVKELRKTVREMEKFIVEDVLNQARVLVTTLVGAASETLRDRRFSTVFIDEAAQGLEPACWIPIRKADRVVLAGDHCQLPPTIKSQKAAREGLEATLFEKCINRWPEAATMLQIQYRMHPKIMGFSSRWFYNNELQAHGSVQNAFLFAENESERNNAPLEFIDTAGCGYMDEQDTETLSQFNPEEGRALLRRLNLLLEQAPGGAEFRIGVITPYRAQVKFLLEELPKYEFLAAAQSLIDIQTVDSFQGQERDVIAISMVRSNEEGQIGFLSDTRRMNVAMTRAKRKLILVGDSATLGGNPFYQAFLEYCEEMDAYQSAWEWME